MARFQKGDKVHDRKIKADGTICTENYDGTLGVAYGDNLVIFYNSSGFLLQEGMVTAPHSNVGRHFEFCVRREDESTRENVSAATYDGLLIEYKDPEPRLKISESK